MSKSSRKEVTLAGDLLEYDRAMSRFKKANQDLRAGDLLVLEGSVPHWLCKPGTVEDKIQIFLSDIQFNPGQCGILLETSRFFTDDETKPRYLKIFSPNGIGWIFETYVKKIS